MLSLLHYLYNFIISVVQLVNLQVKDAFHSPFAALMKGAVILTEDHFLDVMSVAWELLLEWNKEVVAAAASIFILAAVKCPQQVAELMQYGLTHTDTVIRMNSILR